MWVSVVALAFLGVISSTTCNSLSDADGEDNPILDIPNLGKVRGRTMVSYASKRDYSAFMGIRYAKAPSGARRFQPPEFEDPWPDIRDAKFAGQKCPQLGIVMKEGELREEFEQTFRNDPRNWHALLEERMEKELGVEGEQATTDKEDCLFIHIYTPDVNASLPVMVFYHGGAFAGGSANVYGASKFMDKDVVLVVPHYRLGPLGFLSLQTDEIPGNMGLLDQVLSLEWVQKHISAFGGDPDQVTVMGESAGAASSSYLTISPLARGLFKRAIAESGSALADWAIDLTPEYNAINIAALAGCSFNETDGKPDIPKITACLQTVDAMRLTAAYQNYKYQEEKRGRTGFGGCSPIIQRAGAKRYIEDHPEVLIKTGNYTRVPILFGSNRDEGTYVLAIVYAGYMVPNDLTEDEYFLKYKMTDIALSLFNTKDPNYWLIDSIESRFEPVEARGNLTQMIPALIDTLGAAFLKGPVYHAIRYNSLYQESYHYTFNYRGSKSLWSMIGNPSCPFKGGICHANELLYIFSIPLFNIDEEDKIISRRMVEMWTNFATHGNPTPKEFPVEGAPEWPQFNMKDKPYMRIMENFTIQHDFSKEFTIDVDEGMTDA